jgi:hypothetical protein
MGTLEVVQDVAPAAWLHERLWTWGREGVRVGSVIPEGFAAYARVFHPIERERPDGTQERVRWSTVAAENGRTVHHEMQRHLIAAPPGATVSIEYGGRSLDEGTCAALAAVLARFTSKPESCCFGLWSGYGMTDLLPPAPAFGSAFSRGTGREYLLLRGPLDAVSTFHLGLFFLPPNFWWPQDRAWCVATEIDFDWTYVGGSRELIDAVLGTDGLEALETTIDARGDAEGDLVNR